MKVAQQTLQEILSALTLLEVDWQDETARRVIQKLRVLPAKGEYGRDDISAVLDENFDDGLLIVRLFLGLSKDQMTNALADALGKGGSGVTRYRTDRESFIEALMDLGLAEQMSATINRPPSWSDVLVERLRSGRGSAISGQRRGRQLEDFIGQIVKEVFGTNFDERCNFVGQRDRTAKCDFAIPSRSEPRIILEAKAYGATGSKMTDILGDIEKILAAKRHDMVFMLVTDGLTWRQRTSDLAKIVEHQNQGEIFCIYTTEMADKLEADLIQLKEEQSL